MDMGRFGLANAVDSANGLGLCRWIKQWLCKQHDVQGCMLKNGYMPQ